MATAAIVAPAQVTVVRAERTGLRSAMGHDLPCPWCGHGHHFVACEDCTCPAHEHYPGEL